MVRPRMLIVEDNNTHALTVRIGKQKGPPSPAAIRSLQATCSKAVKIICCRAEVSKGQIIRVGRRERRREPRIIYEWIG
jgi:hypothetical protein